MAALVSQRVEDLFPIGGISWAAVLMKYRRKDSRCKFLCSHSWGSLAEIPATTPESDAMAKELKRRGFKFVGSTICYAFMQATGMVNDHTIDCFRYRELGGE